MSLTCTADPASGTGLVSACTQNVSPLTVLRNSWTFVWLPATVLGTAPFQSFPTPYTSEPARVVVNDTEGAPPAALAPPAAPMPAAPLNVITVSD